MTQQCQLSSLKISRILTGLWQIADMEKNGVALDVDATSAAMKAYVQSGFTTFDMADHYGSAEIIAGQYARSFSHLKKPVYLTKWVPKPGKLVKSEVRDAVEKALGRLQSKTLDMLQFHAWNYADPSWIDGLYWLQELKEEGLIRELGVTNFDAIHLRMAIESGIQIVSNQISYSILDQRAKKDMTQVCLDYGVKILAFGTLSGGFLTEKWLGKNEPDQEELKSWSERKYKRFIDVTGGWDRFQDIARIVNKIAKKHDVSMANIASRYILDLPAVGGIIIGARLGSSEHIADNLKTFDFSLDAADITDLDKVQSNLSPVPGRCGDEYRKPPFLTATGDLSDHLEHLPVPYEARKINAVRSHVISGTVWEDLAGFARAIKVGNRIVVSGTTSTHGSKLIGGSDVSSQLHFIIDKIQGVIESLGGRLEDVVRTRVYIRNYENWEEASLVHGLRFGKIQPANTLVQAGLIGEGYLVEMEAEAILNHF